MKSEDKERNTGDPILELNHSLVSPVGNDQRGETKNMKNNCRSFE